jgi:DNA-directed RNA polymerase subunit RPC12/RpoP
MIECECDLVGSACPNPDCQKQYAKKHEIHCPNCGSERFYLARRYIGWDHYTVRKAARDPDFGVVLDVHSSADSDEYEEVITIKLMCADCYEQVMDNIPEEAVTWQ